MDDATTACTGLATDQITRAMAGRHLGVR
eukprot:COSAG01_NODE_14364_length_1463_cov_3.265396_2_plen_28_part_01